MNQKKYGPLTVVLDAVDSQSGEQLQNAPLVTLLHGFGAPGRDLVSLGKMLRTMLFDLGMNTPVTFAFPFAPISLSPFGEQFPQYDSRAWWMIDLEDLDRAVRTGEQRRIGESTPKGIEEAREAFDAMYHALIEDLKPPQTVLGGFSQGSMLAADRVFRSSIKTDGLVLWSSTFLKTEWTDVGGSPDVFISHGTQDPLLPLSLSQELFERLKAESKHDVTQVVFNGAHEIPLQVLESTALFIKKVLSAS